MAVQNMIVAALQFDAQSANEFHLPRKRNRRMDHACTQRSRLPFHFPWLVKRAVECPIDTNIPPPRVPQHAHEPVFYRPTIEIFDYVEHSFRRGTCQITAS